MNVSILSTAMSGGAGIAAFRLHQAFQQGGLETRFYTRHPNRLADQTVVKVSADQSFFSRLEKDASRRLEMLEQNTLVNNRTAISQTMFDIGLASQLDVAEIPELQYSDIVNAHWTSGFAGPHSLGRLAEMGIPVALTLHDEWFYTGGCHYTSGCSRFNTSCDSSCPQVHSDPFEFIKSSFDSKEDFIKRFEPLVISPSTWLTKRAQSSKIFNNSQCLTIPNPFPVDIFRYDHRARFVGGVELPSDSFIILLVAASLDDRRKGFDLALQILTGLRERIGSADASRISVAILGKLSLDCSNIIPFRTIKLGNIVDPHTIAKLYSSADLFLNPTREDNAPNVIIESLLCGTPVISFDVGGIGEQLDSSNGVLVPLGDIQFAVESIQRVFEGSLYFDNPENISKRVAAMHSYGSVSDRYIKVFSDFITRSNYSSSYKRDISPSIARRQCTVPPLLGIRNEELELALRVSPMLSLIEQLESKNELLVLAFQQPLKLDVEYFHDAPQFKALCVEGWSQCEANGRWSSDSNSSVVLPVKLSSNQISANAKLALSLKVRCHGTKQSIFVSTPCTEKKRFDLTNNSIWITYCIHSIPERLSFIHVFFDFPHARKETGGYRLLGVFLEAFKLSAKC